MLQALQQLAAAGKCDEFKQKTYVCFNPYLPDAQQRKDEQQCLRDKLATGIPSGVYLQMGSDVGLLEAGLQFLQHAVKDMNQVQGSIEILGSVFVPSKR